MTEMQIIDHGGGILEFLPKQFADERGLFMETFNHTISSAIEVDGISFIQDNLSVSTRGVIRGLHFQHTPPVGKLVSATKGAVFDVAVDIRSWSKDFGKVYTFILDDVERRSVWIPPGFAHGFQALQDDTIFCYKVTGPWSATGEASINPFDKDLSIRWPISSYMISEKDEIAPPFLYYKGNTLWENE